MMPSRQITGLWGSTSADVFSDLPDSILCHILSFLSTKDAATTSVLSKRWKPLWLSVFTLDFDDTSFKSSPSTFLPAIYSTMQHRDSALPIHSFRFVYHQCYHCRPRFCRPGFQNETKNSLCNQKDVNKFVEFALERGVQSFTLDLMLPYTQTPSFEFELPRRVLNCDTLEVLKLNGIRIRDISHLQDFNLPKLKTLHLNGVFFERNQHRYNLLLGCPLLQDFESKYSVSLKDKETLHLPETFKALPNLIKAKISDDLVRCPLSILCKAKNLYLDMTTPSCFVNVVLFRNAPMFQRLAHLELNFEFMDWHDMCIWLPAILKHSPKLQNLIIQDSIILAVWDDECWEDPEIVPECLSSELKTCCISGYRGNEWEFELAKYIIENSKVLNSMTIQCQCSIGMNDKDQMLGELSSCTKASTTCKLLFD